MVTVGPWVQNPDYLQWATYSTTSTPTKVTWKYGHALNQGEWQEPVQPVDIEMLQDVLISAAEVAGDDINDGLNPYGVTYAWTYDLSFPNWRTSWGADVATGTLHIFKREYEYNPPNFGHAPPPGAIGIDYEGQPYDPADPWAWGVSTQQSLAIDPASKVQGYFRESVGTAYYGIDSAPNTQVYVANPTELAGSVVAEIPAPTVGGLDLVETTMPGIDLTPTLAASDWEGRVYLRVESFVLPWHPPREDPGPYAGGHLEYGWGLKSVRLNAMVRPPRYRWVFADEAPVEVVTYRRTFPRDDVLAGGAGRNYPRPRSSQSSNRTAGAYL